MSLITKATELVAKALPDRKADELRESRRIIGRELDRIDGFDKVTGSAKFAAEYAGAGLAYASLALSSIAKGRIASLDVSQAEAAPGVIAVITHLNAPKLKEPPLFSPGGSGAAGSKANILNTEQIYWSGQPVAVVVANTLDQAEHAATLVEASYTLEDPQLSFASGIEGARPPKNVMGEDTEVKKGDAEGALKDSSIRVDLRYDTPRYNHNAIELHATTASWQDDKLTVYDASQYVSGVANTLAAIFGLKAADVRVMAPFVGGGFGGKGSVWPHVVMCALAAKVVGRPVRLTLSREQVFRNVGGRTPSRQRVALGVDQSGVLQALIHTGVTATSTTNDFAEQFSFPARHLYATQNLYITQRVMHLDTVPNTFMRAPGESIGTFALESAMDELAYASGMDPIELRLRNEPTRDPAKDTEFSARHLRKAYEMGAARFGWVNPRPAPGSLRDGKWRVGHGVATAFYPAYRYPAAAKIRLNADGTVIVQSGAQEMGMGTATVQSQHAADRLGLTMDRIRFDYGDTTLPKAPVAGGSNQTISVALAVELASEKLFKELLKLASKDEDSPLKDAGLEDVEAVDGGLYLKAAPEHGQQFSEILLRNNLGFVEVDAASGPPLETMKYSMGSYGAQFCEVRVHEDTGEVRVSRWVGAFDTGRILNPKTARSQLFGGIVMGIGMALTEESLFDERSGRIMNPSLAEYHLPVNADVPPIDVLFVDIPDPHTPIGAHGIGEIGITGTAAAIANAVFHATGKRIRELPITLDKLLDG
jgi:xanthine dehydrogenase YagR molybdenum-binding subunit